MRKIKLYIKGHGEDSSEATVSRSALLFCNFLLFS